MFVHFTESLLLLIALTKANQEIQKIVAFENAFERLFAIVFEEGAAEGGIIVSDCLQLIQNLLRGNSSNQTFFMETGCTPKLAALFDLKKTDEGKDGWSIQKINTLTMMFELVRIFLSPKSTHAHLSANQVSSLFFFFFFFRSFISSQECQLNGD